MVSDELNQNEETEQLPRVGDGYQADIPALTRGPEYDSYLKRPVDAENKDHVPDDFGLGLPVPVTWIRITNKVKENKKDEKLDFSTQSTEAPEMFGSVKKTSDPCYALVPGVCCDSWTELEEASFLLGLYLLKKKFVPLKQFVGSKKMGDILFFYYTKFYRSPEFSRWSTCTRGRKEKSEYGEWLLSGSRQKELLSRLLPQVSEECQTTLREVTKTYAKKDMSLTKYVFSLKSTVGLKTFVEAVSIGKGNEDLTSMVIRPPRIPAGEAFSYLTHAEIVKLLTGGYSLSDDQSTDLFWIAVWPRLLARGWQSELPKNRAYSSGKMDSLVFLTPGVEKYSRRLVKGDHYFVSVKDVLSKVGSEPELLELDTDYDEDEKEDKGLTSETINQQNLPKKRRCYLEPQTRIHDMDVMKFTVVDTSLGNGKFFRESVTLPMDMSSKKIVSIDSDVDTSDLSTAKSDCSRDMLVNQEINSTTHAKILPGTGKLYDDSSNQLVQIDGPDSTKTVEKTEKKKNVSGDKQEKKPVDIQLSQKLKRNNFDTLFSAPKRHRTAAAYSNEEIGSGSSRSDVNDPNSIAFSQVGSSKNRLSFTSSPKGSPSRSTRGSQYDNDHDQENSRSHMFVDLKFSQQPVDFPGGVLLTDSTNMQDAITSTQQDDFFAPKTSADISVPEQPTEMNSGRKGTRNQTPTARALEALTDFPGGVLHTDSTNMQDVITSTQQDDFFAPKTSADISVPEQPTEMNSRRKGSRNRPPTARALEALVNGDLTTKPRRKKHTDAL